MDDLLASVLDAHGGVDRWARVHTITARLSIGGPFWGRKGWPEIFGDQTTLELDARRQHIVVTPFNGVDRRSVFDVDPERIVVYTNDGIAVERRDDPRASFAGYEVTTPWDALQVGYFISYACWNYLHRAVSVHVSGRRDARARALAGGRRDLAASARHVPAIDRHAQHGAGLLLRRRLHAAADGLRRGSQRRRSRRPVSVRAEDLSGARPPYSASRPSAQPRRDRRPEPDLDHARHHRRRNRLQRTALINGTMTPAAEANQASTRTSPSLYRARAV